jgi:DNA-binding MarR family transcriptional regulator
MPRTGPATEEDESSRLRMAVSRLFRRIERTRAGASLTPSQTTVLATITRQGPLRLSDLAVAEGLNPTMISRIVGDLEAAGLIVRSIDTNDRRAALVAATTPGRELIDRVRSERSDALTAGISKLTAQDQQRLRAALPVLETLAESLKGSRP